VRVKVTMVRVSDPSTLMEPKTKQGEIAAVGSLMLVPPRFAPHKRGKQSEPQNSCVTRLCTCAKTGRKEKPSKQKWEALVKTTMYHHESKSGSL
jgi:hypothetical protein